MKILCFGVKNMTKSKILLIEDNVDSAVVLQEFLEEKGLEVEILTTITDAIFHIKFYKYSLILLDLNLPDYDGYEILKFLKLEKYNIPVIVTSAYNDTPTKLKAFKFGASDYMVKPIDPLELEARIWVHLGKNSDINFIPSNSLFKINNNSIYFKDSLIPLTRTEFKLLKILIDNSNETVTRETLYKVLSPKSAKRTLDGHIKNIRKKLKKIDPYIYDIIVTEYGLGYRLVV